MLTRSGLNTISGIPCLPAIYLDGFQVQSSGDLTGDREFDLRTLLASHILAIEAFRGAAEVPAQYSGASSACGVIMIWTKDGLPVPRPLGRVR
jgi:hypothetical protein